MGGAATPDGLDQSWGFASPKVCKQLGIRVVSMYLSWSPDKNITAAKVKAYHKVDTASMLNWESHPGAPLLGANQGAADAREAVRLVQALIREVGYSPGNRLIIYFSCDTDVAPHQYPQIEAYYRAAKHVCAEASFGIGVYGEAALVAHLSKIGITDAEWQTYAWSGGVLSPAADFYQYLNGQNLGGASVDFDRVIHERELGAWWAPGNPLNEGEDELTDDQIKEIAKAVWNETIKYGDEQHRARTWLAQARNNAGGARSAAHAADDKLDTALTVLGEIGPRVAKLQSSVAGVAKTVAALAPGSQVVIDYSKIAGETATAVWGKVKGMTLEVKH